MESGPLPAVTAVTVTSAGAGEGDASGAAVGAAVATEASAGADEAGAWELLKRRVAENRKLSTENRRLRNELGDQQVRARLCRCRRVAADRALLPAQRATQASEQQLREVQQQNAQLQRDLTELQAAHVRTTGPFCAVTVALTVGTRWALGRTPSARRRSQRRGARRPTLRSSRASLRS